MPAAFHDLIQLPLPQASPFWVSALAALTCTAGLAAYPDRPVVLVVPFAPGTPSDRIARDLAEALRKPLGPVVVENIAGNGGNVGAGKVALSAPDGYTLLLHHIGMATAPAIYRNLSFKPLADFEYLGLVSELPMTLIGKPNLAANSFVELNKWLDANRGNVNMAHVGLGSASWLCSLSLQNSLKMTLAPVAYKAAGPAVNDLHGGQVDLMCDQTTDTEAQIEGGLVKAYAVTTRRRVPAPALASLPTLGEAGLKGFDLTIWHGLYAPRGTPVAVLDKVNAALREALRDPEFIQREETLGAEVVTDDRATRAGHRRFVEAETARWTPMIRAAGQFAD